MATSRYCVLIAEIDGTELEYNEELGLDADKVYFTNVDYVADNTQDAIIETITKAGSARTPYGFYFSSNANSGRWLEVSGGISSETSPHISPETGTLKAITLSVKNSATVTVSIYLNGAVINTISLVGSQVASISGLSTSIAANDTLSAQITDGSCSEPNLQVQVQVQA